MDACLDNGWVAAGPDIQGFEEDLQEAIGATHVVACASGTAALHVALLSMEIGPGDLVLAPTVTFIATINAIHYTGADPVLVDCDEYLGIDPSAIERFFECECAVGPEGPRHRKTGKRLAAVVPVHLFGIPVAPEVFDICNRFGVPVLEDAAESIGASWLDGSLAQRQTGTVGRAGVLSFNANKIVSSAGGGALLTDDEQTALQARRYINQFKGDDGSFIHQRVGYNYRLSNIHAALGRAQLARLDTLVTQRRERHALYAELLAEIPGLRVLGGRPGTLSSHWLPVLTVEPEEYGASARELCDYLAQQRIEARGIWMPVHLQPAYRSALTVGTTRADTIARRVLNLPSSNGMPLSDVERVVQAILEAPRKVPK